METRLAPFLKKPYKGTKKTEKRTALEPIYSRRKPRNIRMLHFYNFLLHLQSVQPLHTDNKSAETLLKCFGG